MGEVVQVVEQWNSNKRSLSDDEFVEKLQTSNVDLSNQLLEKLPNLRGSFTKVKYIDLSNNRLKLIGSLAKFPSLTEVNVSRNKLERLSSFVPLARTLERLDVSHNEIGNCNHLTTLTQLVWLNLASNKITAIPTFDRISSLTFLNLSNNHLKALPNLRNLPRLRVLNLYGNQVKSLGDAQCLLPATLNELNIGRNEIVDLREAQNLRYFKNLTSLSWFENPCVRVEDCTFNYRPYLYCCCLEVLKIIDGIELNETEIVKGEELHTNAKFRGMETHAKLCDYLSKKCSGNFDDLLSPESKQLYKVLCKRREYVANEKSTDESSASAYHEWLEKSTTTFNRNFGNRNHGDLKDAYLTDISYISNSSSTKEPTPRTPTSATSNISSSTVTLSAPTAHVFASYQPKSHKKRKSATEKQLSKRELPSSSNRKIITRSPKKLLTNCTQDHPVYPRILNICKYTQREHKSACTIQKWWRCVRLKKAFRLRFLEERVKNFEKKLELKTDFTNELCQQMCTIGEKCNQLMTSLAEHKEIVAENTKCMEKMTKLLDTLLPAPAKLNYERKSSNEVVLKWIKRCHNPTGYGIKVNDRLCGVVNGNHKKVLVTDLDPYKPSSITVQCIYGEYYGSVSEKLMIPAAEEKNDQSENNISSDESDHLVNNQREKKV